MIYLSKLAFVIRNFVIFRQESPILLNPDVMVEKTGLVYESFELRDIRTICQKDPKSKLIPAEVVKSVS